MEQTKFTGDFYDEQYFLNGKKSGKGWLENYRFLPRRTIKESLAFIDTLNLDENSKVLEVGCAFGFLVKCMRFLQIPTSGCDISEYALSHAPAGCYNLSDEKNWKILEECGFTHIIIKDMLEHLTPDQLKETMEKLAKIAPKMMVVVPMGNNGKYRIPEYHMEVSHLIAEDEEWWEEEFENSGWKITSQYEHVWGLKDNWFHVCPNGNRVFLLERKEK